MIFFQIPLASGNQAFNVQLSGVLYRLRLVWRDSPDRRWFMDIGYPDGRALVNGLPLAIGGNILEQHLHLIPGEMYVIPEGDSEPGFNDLLTTKIYWIGP